MNGPVAVFDSGVGGISVLRELCRLMPEEDFLYFGDSKNAPYGTRTVEEVRNLTNKNIIRLIEMGAKAVVIACNTATSAAAEGLRRAYSIPIIGIEPALKPAAEAFPGGKVVVMATEMTIREKKFLELAGRFSDTQIFSLPAPGIVDLVEAGKADSPEMDEYLRSILTPYESADAVVLGCTHFPFAKKAITRLMPNAVLFDGGAGTARETRRRLKEKGILGGGTGKVTVTGSLPETVALAEKLLNARDI